MTFERMGIMTEWEERYEDRSLRGGNDKHDGRFSNGGWLGGFCACTSVFSLFLSSCSCCSLFAKLEHWETPFASVTEAVLTVGSPVRPAHPSSHFGSAKPLSCLSEINSREEKGKKGGEALRSVLNRAFALVLISIVMWFLLLFLFHPGSPCWFFF